LAHIAVRRRCGAFWVLAVWAPQVAVAAVPAIYLLVFSTLPLRNALVVTT